ncbi:hypothetical protein GY45DRAFT_1324954 [Cubamyces sp. BRFM 1775]|nr:hypothetical protein GY45DRAFT_1324954 [Cubamyces sp. BRFM 1775]
MLAFAALAAALSASSAMATPLKRATPGPSCDGLGSGAFDTSSSFTLAAYNTTGPNANSTGAPLVLGTAGVVQQTQIWHFITEESWGSYPITYPTVSLQNGTLILHSDGATPTQATTVDAGNSLEFVARTSADPSAGAQIYCAVQGDAGLPLLAVNNDADSFSLCQTTFENVVYYKAAPDRGYDFDSCYPVKLQILFQ